MVALAQQIARRRIVPSRLFNDRPEESLRLRLLTLLTVLSVALSLGWVTDDLVIPVAGSALAAAGHFASWRWRRSSLGYRSTAIMVAIVALSIATRDDFVSAFSGDRLPVAQYLLLIIGTASFGTRTRGGLYAQLILSGLVLFFVSERAFDQTFVAFLILFLGLFLTFAAMSFMEDQLRIAKVHWPPGQLGRFWFWLGVVGGGLLVCSALAFSLMPADHQGHSGSQRVGIVPFLGESDSALPSQQAALGPVGPEVAPEEPGSAEGVSDLPGAQDWPRTDLTGSVGGDFEGQQAAADPRDVVMHVRSPVTSYWRGGVFDRFDGQTWYPVGGVAAGRAVPFNRNYYWQFFFMERDQPGLLFAGYTPIRLVLPRELREQGSLVSGATYSALSQRPELTRDSVRNDRAGRPGTRYLSEPDSSERVHRLARSIVGDASTPFEQLWLIVSYLRQHHSYDAAAEDQLQLSRGVEAFLREGTSGTSIDFATATILLARAAGIPARLAVGYLPGRFDPFSGTHEVRKQHAHAWAEVSFSRAGWVAFDATPRPELEVFTGGRLAGFGGTAYVFQTRVGGGLYRALQSGASDASERLGDALEGRGTPVRAVAGVVVAAILGLAAYWAFRRRPIRSKQQWRYSRLQGEVRGDVMRSYARLERLLRRRGLGLRGRSQTLRHYAEVASRQIDHARKELEWFTGAAWSAAYDPVEPAPELAREAEQRLSLLRHRLSRGRYGR